MAKFHDTFGFFDTVEQAEQFKEKLLNHYQNNRYYMKKYAQEITIGPWLNSNSKNKAFVIHYYCEDDWHEKDSQKVV